MILIAPFLALMYNLGLFLQNVLIIPLAALNGNDAFNEMAVMTA